MKERDCEWYGRAEKHWWSGLTGMGPGRWKVMTEDGSITLRELFKIDPREVSARAESGVDLYREAAKIKESVQKEARTIRWPWVRDLVAEKASDVLNLNVVNVLMDAWNKYAEIAKYADREKYGPEESILVPLAEHTVKSKHHPYVEILLHDAAVGRVEFDLDFSLTLEGFVLKIQDGMIREIKTGSAKGEGSLTLASATLLKRELQPLHFPGHIPLGHGIRLRGRGKAASA